MTGEKWERFQLWEEEIAREMKLSPCERNYIFGPLRRNAQSLELLADRDRLEHLAGDIRLAAYRNGKRFI